MKKMKDTIMNLPRFMKLKSSQTQLRLQHGFAAGLFAASLFMVPTASAGQNGAPFLSASASTASEAIKVSLNSAGATASLVEFEPSSHAQQNRPNSNRRANRGDRRANRNSSRRQRRADRRERRRERRFRNRSDRNRSDRNRSDRQRGDRNRDNRPRGDGSRGDRPRGDKSRDRSRDNGSRRDRRFRDDRGFRNDRRGRSDRRFRRGRDYRRFGGSSRGYSRYGRNGRFGNRSAYRGRSFSHGYVSKSSHGYFCSEHSIFHYFAGFSPIGYTKTAFYGRRGYRYADTCYPVEKVDYYRGRKALVKAIACYDEYDNLYIKKGSYYVSGYY